MNPLLRYETTNLSLSANSAPVYPNRAGIEFLGDLSQHPKYINIERSHPITNVQWRVNAGTETQRDNLWTFWNTTLERGRYDFTVVDHRKRFLFEASWDQWKERWQRKRGGTFSVALDLDSAVGWLPPAHAFYTMAENNLECHSEQSADELTVTNAALVTNATDSDVLRLNGYALRLAEQAGASTGATSSSLSWSRGNEYDNLAIFCQFSACDLNAGRTVDLVNMTDGAGNTIRIYVTTSAESSSSSSSASSASGSSSSGSSSSSSSSASGSSSSATESESSASSASSSSASSSSASSSSSTSQSESSSSSSSTSSTSSASSESVSGSSSSSSSSESSSESSSSSSDEGSPEITLVFSWQAAGQPAETLSVDGLNTEGDGSPAWYDICLTHDGVNDNWHAYYCRSATDTTWSQTDDFLYGLTTLGDGILNDTTPTASPSDVTWTTLSLLVGDAADLYADNGEYFYVQNIAIFDDFIPPMEFNTLRRLCHLWNNKTASYPK